MQDVHTPECVFSFNSSVHNPFHTLVFLFRDMKLMSDISYYKYHVPFTRD